MINKKYMILTAEGEDFSEMSERLIGHIELRETPLRLAFFGAPINNQQYLAQLEVLRSKVKERYPENTPMVAYIAQRPLVGVLKLEVTALGDNKDITIEYHQNYLLIKHRQWTEMITGGIIADDITKPVYEQSKDIFNEIERILDKEGFRIDDIVRQWNYIERITEPDQTGRQSYQEFNDARSEFYAKTEWTEGYPAATGIGTQLGGIMVELNVIKGNNITNLPIDNSMQIAAHAYSQDVLIGKAYHKSTPKFERARIVGANHVYSAFISGTAAIRGEESISPDDIAEQTRITMENIEFLISEENTKIKGQRRYKLLRIYIKNPDQLEMSRSYMNIYYPHVPKFYLYADICRDELLIEIEGVAEIQNP